MDETDEAPLTLGQERLWFLDRLDPGNPAYNIGMASRLTGPLDIERLRRAYDTVVARHAPLRTRYREVDGAPVQQAMAAGPVPMSMVDLTGHDDPEGRARALVNAYAKEPFDIATGPPLRVGLLRLGDDHHVLCTTMHHIAGDGWSTNLLYRELTDVYNGRALPSLPTGYFDVARAQRDQGEDDDNLTFWRDQLAGPPVLELPTDRPRPSTHTPTGGVVRRELSGETSRRVRAVARELRCTPYLLMLTVFDLMLAQFSGQDDICVGTPVAGRDDPDLEALIGYFMGVLVLRADMSGSPSLRELVLRTRQTFMAALAHQPVPFERLAVDLPRDGGSNPLFRATFTLHNTIEVGTTASDGFDGVRAEAFDAGAQPVTVDLALDVFPAEHSLVTVFAYDAGLFDRASVDAFADRFATLLEAVLTAPDTLVRDLPLIDDEQAHTLRRWGTGPALGPLPDLTEIASDAGAVALACGGREMTYGELRDRADVLAGELRAAGVAAGDLVGIALPRSFDLIAAMLAAWCVGAGYVPLDPDQPAARYDAMAAAAGVAAIVDGEIVAAQGPHTTVEDPAYVVFTSGSTGAPKPVLVGREALAARVAWMVGDYALGPGDRVVQFAAAGFDTHAEEIWPALVAGATVVMLPDGPHSLPEVLAADPGITVLDLPTAYWASLLPMLDDIAWPPALRLVILGGEEVGAESIATWRARFGDRVRLVNTYGPTEATVIATATDLTDDDTTRRPPIGRPIAGVEAYVCDSDGRLMAPGVAGELRLGGVGLARGYLGREDLTAARFPATRYGRLYRTGDRVRWRVSDSGATLEFLGRLDDQIKVRGIRVEPAEVEAVLRGHPGVEQAVVVGIDGALIAYTVGPAAAAEVRAHAAGHLPALLVPSVVVPLAALPLTRNGKVDVRALPAPDRSRDAAIAFVAPRSDAETLVAAVWTQVLGIDTIGAGDDFFALGGHSLLATRVIARLRAAVDVDVPIRAIFTHPTVAALATVVEDTLIAEIERMTEAEAADLVVAGGAA